MSLGTWKVGTASTGVSPKTPAVPASLADGDVLILIAGIDGTTSPTFTVTPGTGTWTSINNALGGTTVRVQAWYQVVATAAGWTAPSVSWSSGNGRVWLQATPGAHQTTPVPAGSSTGTGTDATIETSATTNPGTRGAMLCQAAINTTPGTVMTADQTMVASAQNGNTGGTTTAHSFVGFFTEPSMSEDAPATASRATGAAAAQWAQVTFWIVPATADATGLRQSRGAANASAASQTIVYPAALVAGTLLVATASVFGVDVTAVSHGTGFTAGPHVEISAGGVDVSLWYLENNAATTAVTVTYTLSVAAPATPWISEWKGIATASSLATSGTSTGNGTTITTTTSGNTPAAGSLAINAFDYDSNTTVITFDANYTKREARQPSGQDPHFVESRELTSGGTTESVTPTSSLTAGVASVLAVFSLPAAATKAPPPFQRPWRYLSRRKVA